jgi:hypothetical protein
VRGVSRSRVIPNNCTVTGDLPLRTCGRVILVKHTYTFYGLLRGAQTSDNSRYKDGDPPSPAGIKPSPQSSSDPLLLPPPPSKKPKKPYKKIDPSLALTRRPAFSRKCLSPPLVSLPLPPTSRSFFRCWSAQSKV